MSEENVSPEAAHTLRIIALAMGGGMAMMAGLVAWAYFNAAARTPTALEVRGINTLTIAVMAMSFASIAASEVVWRMVLRKSQGELSRRVLTAYIVRLACREMPGLFGLTVAYVGAVNGVLKIYPSYWVNLVPFGLFLGFLASHFPAVEKLTSEAREAAGSGL